MKQITCNCSAYNFPHRLGGGKCSGSEWAESYFMTVGECCKQCNCNNGGCEVATGQENISQCEGAIDFIHYGVDTKLPRTEEQALMEMIDGYIPPRVG